MFKFRLKFLLSFLSFLVFFCPVALLAKDPLPPPTLDFSAYRQLKAIIGLNILVPTVIEVPFVEKNLERSDFIVVDEMVQTALPHYFKTETITNQTYYTIDATPYTVDSYNMIDGNSKSFAEFNLQGQEPGSVVINLRTDNPVTSSALTVLLDANVALPTAVEISAKVDGFYKIVLAKTSMFQQTIKFPETTATDWQIGFHYSQPLRINELRLVQNNLDTVSQQAVRFLAQPNGHYKIYFDPDRSVTVKTSEAGNLASPDDVLFWGQVVTTANPFYLKADIDQDGVPDYIDNCVSVANSDQIDINNNGRGDKCDDFDKDGVINNLDNCQNNPNFNQADIDKDGLGDVCDTQESRVTEKYKWLPWLGIVFALGVVIVLFVITLKSKKPNNQG